MSANILHMLYWPKPAFTVPLYWISEDEEENKEVDASAGRFVRYQFTPAFLKLRTVGATWVASADALPSTIHRQSQRLPLCLWQLDIFSPRLSVSRQGRIHRWEPTPEQFSDDRAALLPRSPAEELRLWLWLLYSKQSKHLWAHLWVPPAVWEPGWVIVITLLSTNVSPFHVCDKKKNNNKLIKYTSNFQVILLHKETLRQKCFLAQMFIEGKGYFFSVWRVLSVDFSSQSDGGVPLRDSLRQLLFRGQQTGHAQQGGLCV